MMKNLKKKGFTIVELVIVIAVIAVLAAVLIPTFSGVIQKANDSSTIQEARNMYSEYVSLFDYTTGTPETTFVIKVDDDKYVAVVNGQLVTETIYASKDAVVAANIGITNSSFVYEGVVNDDNDEDVTPPAGGEETPEPNNPKVWYAIGDSITNGKDGADTNADRWTLNSGWIKYVMEENGYDTERSKNLGVSAIGFNTKANYDSLYIRDVIECSDAVKNGATVKSKWGTYTLADADIITVALGINDWKNSAITIKEYFDEMEYCLKRIREINPSCDIYYIMPFNMIIGEKLNNYALGYKNPASTSSYCYGNTLSEFKQMIRDKFALGEFGDVKLIDIEPLTVDEMDLYLPDKIHPNSEGYEIIGRKIAEKMRELQ